MIPWWYAGEGSYFVLKAPAEKERSDGSCVRYVAISPPVSVLYYVRSRYSLFLLYQQSRRHSAKREKAKLKSFEQSIKTRSLCWERHAHDRFLGGQPNSCLSPYRHYGEPAVCPEAQPISQSIAGHRRASLCLHLEHREYLLETCATQETCRNCHCPASVIPVHCTLYTNCVYVPSKVILKIN